MTFINPPEGMIPLDDDMRPVYEDPGGKHSTIQWMAWAIWRAHNKYGGNPAAERWNEEKWHGLECDYTTDWDDPQ